MVIYPARLPHSRGTRMKPSLTLAMEGMLTDPRYARAAEVLRSMAPVSFRDQADAAFGETDGVRNSILAALSPERFRGGYVAAESHPEWLRLGVCDALATWILGEASTCCHNPEPTRPQPLVACAWKPGLVVCVRCTHLLSNRRGSLADRTCDGCGHECTGPDNDDGVFPGMVQLGVLLYEFGTCTSCHQSIPKPE
jgi:hypothetical protein